MLNLTHRSLHKEFLDETNIPYDDVKLNMQELNTINTLLGGHRITLQGFKQLLGQRTKLSVMEIGCGGGDNLKVIEAYCKKINIDVELLGIDINQAILGTLGTSNGDFAANSFAILTRSGSNSVFWKR